MVSAGRVFVHGRRGDLEVVTAFDLASGARLWRHDYPARFVQNTIVPTALPGPFATPAVDGGRVFTLGAGGILSSWDAASGDLLWRNDYSASVQVAGLFCGTAASPLVDAGRLIVQVGSDPAGGPRARTRPGDGRRDLGVARGGSRLCVADPDRGRRPPPARHPDRVVDRRARPRPRDACSGARRFTDEWNENIMTPVWTGVHLVVSGPRQGTHAFTIRRHGDAWQAAAAWSNPGVTMYMTSPVLADGIVYGHSTARAGQFVALDALTGTVQWSSEGREGEYAAALLATGLLLLTGDAELMVERGGAAGPHWGSPSRGVRRHYDVADGATWTVPVPLPDGLLVRDATGLARLVAAD